LRGWLQGTGEEAARNGPAPAAEVLEASNQRLLLSRVRRPRAPRSPGFDWRPGLAADSIRCEWDKTAEPNP